MVNKIESDVLPDIIAVVKSRRKESFAVALQEVRKPIMRQEDLASWIGYSDNTVSRWETYLSRDDKTPLSADERSLPQAIDIVYKIVEVLTQNNSSEGAKRSIRKRLIDAYICDSMERNLAKLGIQDFDHDSK